MRLKVELHWEQQVKEVQQVLKVLWGPAGDPESN